MATGRSIHPDFQFYLDFKNPQLIELYIQLRRFIFDICPHANELLYHTHALTSVYAVSKKLSDAFCMIPIYTEHLNLGFNKGTLLKDPTSLLEGTGTLIRHIPVRRAEDFKNKAVEKLVLAAYDFAVKDADGGNQSSGLTISKIKR